MNGIPRFSASIEFLKNFFEKYLEKRLPPEYLPDSSCINNFPLMVHGVRNKARKGGLYTRPVHFPNSRFGEGPRPNNFRCQKRFPTVMNEVKIG